MGQNNQEYRLKYWATHSSVRSFACTAHSFACSRLLALLIPKLVRKWMIGWLFVLFFQFWPVVHDRIDAHLSCCEKQYVNGTNCSISNFSHDFTCLPVTYVRSGMRVTHRRWPSSIKVVNSCASWEINRTPAKRIYIRHLASFLMSKPIASPCS